MNKKKNLKPLLKQKPKALVLFSGGLDSRLVIQLLKPKYNLTAIYFHLPFGCNAKLKEIKKYTKENKIKLKIFNTKKSPLLNKYLKLIHNPNHGYGSSKNPCKDCKIWMLKLAKSYADKNKIKIIATGEVKGQRPMSQTSQSLDLIERKSKVIPIRPLVELGIQGRKRNQQMQLAKQYKIKYPSPSGGCLLCEKQPGQRIHTLLQNNLINEKTLELTKISRHLIINNQWFVIGKNEQENKIIEKYKNSIKSKKKTPAVYYYKKQQKEKAKEIQQAYKNKQYKYLEQYKI